MLTWWAWLLIALAIILVVAIIVFIVVKVTSKPKITVVPERPVYRQEALAEMAKLVNK